MLLKSAALSFGTAATATLSRAPALAGDKPLTCAPALACGAALAGGTPFTCALPPALPAEFCSCPAYRAAIEREN